MRFVKSSDRIVIKGLVKDLKNFIDTHDYKNSVITKLDDDFDRDFSNDYIVLKEGVSMTLYLGGMLNRVDGFSVIKVENNREILEYYVEGRYRKNNYYRTDINLLNTNLLKYYYYPKVNSLKHLIFNKGKVISKEVTLNNLGSSRCITITSINYLYDLCICEEVKKDKIILSSSKIIYNIKLDLNLNVTQIIIRNSDEVNEFCNVYDIQDFLIIHTAKINGNETLIEIIDEFPYIPEDYKFHIEQFNLNRED